jgi:crotonobetainyl-CoA:carnitine CoA-transferase CaiB-like acyl-CoA transferase
LTDNLASEATGPLKDIRILDMTGVVFGSYATQMLADLGADVIKVESPPGGPGGGGDIIRQSGKVPEGAPRELGPIYMTINRNKRSVVLDLTNKADAATIREIIATCDAFITSVRYNGLTRLGLDYEGVKSLKPDIVYVHGAGYGSDGPYAGRPAYDDLLQGAVGLADLLPRTSDDPSLRLIPSLLADKVSAHFLVQAALAALLHQARTGQGQFVEVPMYECMTAFNLVEHFYNHVFDPPTGPMGYTRLMNPHRRPYQTKDGFVGLMPYNQQQWEQFFKVIGAGETWGKDPRFIDYAARSKNARDLYQLMGELAKERTTAEWIALLKPLNIPVVPARRLEELLEDEHLREVGFFQSFEHPEAGKYYAIRAPIKFDETPANIRRHPPMMGEHTVEVIEEARQIRSSGRDKPG